MTVPADVLDRIRTLAEAGRSAREIGKEVGRSAGSIQYICQRYEIVLRCRPGPQGGGAWSPQRRAAYNAMRADPERDLAWRSKQSMFGCEPSDEVRPCAPGAWEAALNNARFHDAPPWVLDLEPPGAPPPRREISTGYSSMAYL